MTQTKLPPRMPGRFMHEEYVWIGDTYNLLQHYADKTLTASVWDLDDALNCKEHSYLTTNSSGCTEWDVSDY